MGTNSNPFNMGSLHGFTCFCSEALCSMLFFLFLFCLFKSVYFQVSSQLESVEVLTPQFPNYLVLRCMHALQDGTKYLSLDNQHNKKHVFFSFLLFSGFFHYMPHCCTFLFNGVYVLITPPDSSCLYPR